jgi:hypothetical protein
VVLLDGPAGIGKTSLAQAVREAARERGFAVLAATGSELDRDFPFGLVHQLLDGVLAGAEPERRGRLLAGAAALAEVVLSPAAAGAAPDPSHASLHGLYWLCANLAEECPLLLVVDDLHWGDAASLRFLEFLGRRLEGLPLLVLAAARSGEAGPAEELLGLIAAGPAAQTVAPAPLSAAAVAEALAAQFGAPPDPAFAAASAQATGGNPLLVRELIRAARETGLSGTAEEAEGVASLAGAGVAGATRRRLARLGPTAASVAAAATVLGDAPRPDDLAALTGLEDAAVAETLDRLARAEVLTPQRAFVHPLVREALAGSIAPAERSRLHAVAASRLAARGAAPTAVAVHLLACEPAGEEWVVDVLRRAARAAVAEGAGDTAVAHLRRALAEPPASRDRAGLLLELGERRLAAGDAQGVDDLTAALDAGLQGDEAARALAAAPRSACSTTRRPRSPSSTPRGRTPATRRSPCGWRPSRWRRASTTRGWPRSARGCWRAPWASRPLRSCRPTARWRRPTPPVRPRRSSPARGGRSRATRSSARSARRARPSTCSRWRCVTPRHPSSQPGCWTRPSVRPGARAPCSRATTSTTPAPTGTWPTAASSPPRRTPARRSTSSAGSP